MRIRGLAMLLEAVPASFLQKQDLKFIFSFQQVNILRITEIKRCFLVMVSFFLLMIVVGCIQEHSSLFVKSGKFRFVFR